MNEFIFLWGCIFVGVLMIVESIVLKRSQGHFQKNPFLALASLLEFVWLGVSVYALFKLPLTKIQMVLPTLFVLHYGFGWFYNLKQLQHSGVIEKIKAGEDADIVLPKKSIDYSASFALVYTVASVVFLVNYYQPFLPK